MISYEDILEAQAEWAAAVVATGRLKDNRQACLDAAGEAVDRLYAFNITDVLFKPTKAVFRSFRSTRDGAISYFIGGNPDFPEDSGFAMTPWTDVRFENAVHYLQDDKAFVMGTYYFTGPNEPDFKVEYSLGYLRTPEGCLKIFLHHSSIPYNPDSPGA